MARKIIHQLVDDLDGTEIPVGEGETVRFSLEGRAYEIDLSTANAEQLRDVLAPFVKAARRQGGAAPRRRGGRRDVEAIRAWARGNGYSISDRGRIPVDIEEAYAASGA